MISRIAVSLCLAAFVGCAALRAAESSSAPRTEITASRMESQSTDTEMTTTFTGDVVVTGDNIRIACDRLEVVSIRLGEKDQVVARQNQFKSLVGTGHVKIVQGDRVATCGRAVVLPGEDKITLTENPMVEDHGADVTWIGETLLLLRGERRVQGTKIHMILPPIKDLGFDKNQKVEPARPQEAK